MKEKTSKNLREKIRMNENIKKEVKKTYQDIKEMKVQGATDVALEAIKSLKHIESEEELNESIQLLKKSRPTEPMMQNGLKYIKSSYKEGRDIKKSVEEFKQMIDNSVKKIVETGSRYISPETNIMTHCHSSLVEKIIIKANEEEKINKVIVTETRPRYQGRITAKELAKEGINVELGVDSARIELMKEVDLAIVGADLITSDGYLFNKIGTHELALSAHNMKGTNFLVAAQLLKIDPMTLSGKRAEVEERSTKEVWENPPKGVKIRNPAFDATPPRYINSMITEEGIIHPFNTIDNAEKKYPWIFE